MEKRSRSETPKLDHCSPFDTSQLAPKLLTPPTSFESFFSRPHPSQFNFYPHHLLTQPLNFSANRMPFPSMMSPMPPITSQASPYSKNTASNNGSNSIQQETRNFIDDLYKKDRMMQEKRSNSLKKIDRIAENLRYGANSASPPSSASPSSAKSFLDHFNQLTVKKEGSPAVFPMSPQSASAFLSDNKGNMTKTPSMDSLLNYSNDNAKKSATVPGTIATTNSGPTTKIPNSKLFAKCFICSKLLSNQYNLRVHLETHQNMRFVGHSICFACCVCSSSLLFLTHSLSLSLADMLAQFVLTCRAQRTLCESTSVTGIRERHRHVRARIVESAQNWRAKYNKSKPSK